MTELYKIPGKELDYRRTKEDFSETYSLVHSPDDGGWYWQRWSDDAVSMTYEHRWHAISELADGTTDTRGWND